MIHFWSWLSLNVTVGLNNIGRDIDFSFINLLYSFEVGQKLGESVIKSFAAFISFQVSLLKFKPNTVMFVCCLFYVSYFDFEMKCYNSVRTIAFQPT